MYDEFEKRDTAVVAIAQEDRDVASHKRILRNFKDDRPFQIVADIGYKKTKAYDRTTAYLIDKKGIVRQVFPMLIHSRPTWKAILGEVDKLVAEQKTQ